MQHINWKKMTLLHIMLSILGTLSWATEGDTSKPPVDIYWNRTNSIFSQTNNDHILEVQIKERIRFLCPYYDSADVDTSQPEHYIIYRLPKRYYDDCYIPEYANEAQLRNDYGIEKVHNCSSPYDQSVFISYIDTFVPLPGLYGGLRYNYGQEYYFTSISTGTVRGIHNRLSANSACKNFNMKAIVRVCCNDNATFTCPPEVIKCQSSSAFTDPPLVTGDVIQPTPPTARPTTPTAKPTPTRIQPTSTWSTIRAVVTDDLHNTKMTTGKASRTDASHVGDGSSSAGVAVVSIMTVVLGLIFSRLTLELT